MKFNIGDTVKIREDLIEGEQYGYMTFLRGATCYRGETHIIDDITKNGHYSLDRAGMIWSAEMLQLVKPVMPATEVLGWLRKHRDTGVIYDVFSVELEDLFDFATDAEIVVGIERHEMDYKSQLQSLPAFVDLNSVYANNGLFYWCNCCGDINLKGDPVNRITHHDADELPPKARELYTKYHTEGNGCTEYVVDYFGRTGYAFTILFDEDWTTETLKLSMEQLLPRITKMASKLLLADVFEGCTFLMGYKTDPIGSELMILVPYEQQENIPVIQKMFASGEYDPYKWIEKNEKGGNERNG